jgi:hypothetical protein
VCREPTAVPGRAHWFALRCRACGTEFVATDGSSAPPPPAAAPPKPKRRERVYLRQADVLVTDTRLVADGRTLALDAVTACRVEVEHGGWRWPPESLLAVIAALGLLAAAAPGIMLAGAGHIPLFPRVLGVAIAGMLLVLAGLMAREGWAERFYRLDRYRLMIRTPAGEVPAFADADAELVARVAAALKDALAARRG